MKASELILNADGSIYHLQLLPEDLAKHVITVGDPDRAIQIGRRLDRIEVQKQKREFLTLTGFYKDLKLTVISTGIGTDNIDIVFNELDALWNIDLQSRRIRDTLTSAKMLRLGTTGSLQEDILVDRLIFSQYALGADGLMEYYQRKEHVELDALESAFQSFASNQQALPSFVYGAAASPSILPHLPSDIYKGITLTAKGFYAPQGRNLGRLKPLMPNLVDLLSSFTFQGIQLTNMEMETAGILGLGGALGHEVASLSVALANRKSGHFSTDSQAAIDRLIEEGLEVMYKWSQE